MRKLYAQMQHVGEEGPHKFDLTLVLYSDAQARIEVLEKERDKACLALWCIARGDWPYLKDSLRVARMREDAQKALATIGWELTSARAAAGV